MGTYNGVEEGGLADVGEADDAGLEAHANPRARGVEASPLMREEERRGGNGARGGKP